MALALLRRGIANVFVLDGGLNAWKAEGHPVTTALSSSTESHAKLGIRLFKPSGSESDPPRTNLNHRSELVPLIEDEYTDANFMLRIN